MTISQTFYDLEKEVRNQYGEQWYYKLDTNHPMVVAMRSSLQTVVKEEELCPVKEPAKPKRLFVKACRGDVHLGTFETIKECEKATGVTRYIISRKLRGFPTQTNNEYTFAFVMEGE